MKKNFFLILLLLISKVWAFTGETIVDTVIYDSRDNSSVRIQKGITVKFDDIIIQFKKFDNSVSKPYLEIFAESKNRNITGWNSLLDIKVNNVIIPDTLKNQHWSPLYEVQVLKYQNKKIVEENNIFYANYKQWKNYTDFQNEDWYDSYISPEFFISDGIIYLTDTSVFGGRTTGIINKFNSAKNEIEWTCIKSISSDFENVKNLPSVYAKKFKENMTYNFKFELDGDYLTVFLDGKSFEEWVHLDSSTKNEIRISIYPYYNEKIDLKNVHWPRHADGTCDYDNSKSTAKIPTAPYTNVSVKKLMTTNCNLKLRAAEATSSNVLTVMAQGTKVKILELGIAETIDGISSNWVKVEVQKGAKDRDGKAIAPKTVGWCYGGYLE